ncbi:thioredoxin [Aerococcaceae bacterium NML191292]|nr:thioredoxin [Aerococcaceae bacterium NML210727]MCW6654122.1 thioredoxin [Aerococcaceae bacterium NML201296]MCW6659839.1 thioredoxin [Aerococcaceae bacterium NML191292]MCW6661821.1 thioredoxin [Aerococcaceae bacterium NML201209]MCW6666395.1 thioredoxin [Aerococcaceae bacterium NML190938]MCW6680737.1 thioredoxin [Aerococcaceae bacterium NML130460]MDO4774641.1 thioredoxin [Aerococcaceae bacterium]
MAKDLQDAQFAQATAEGLTVVDFWAPWCGPCRMQTPIIDKLSAELEGQVEFFKMNVDEEQATAQQFGIMSIPTLIVKKDGEVVEKLVGFHDEARLKDVLSRYM